MWLIAIALVRGFAAPATVSKTATGAPVAAATTATTGASDLLRPASRQRARFCDFHPLNSPEAYEELMEDRAADEITVVKWSSDSCRTCRAAQPKIRGVLKKWDDDVFRNAAASYYSVDLRSDNKDVMFGFFKARNITHMPCIELYVGNELLQTLVVPPSRVAFLRNGLFDALDHVGAARRRRARRRMLLDLRARKAALVKIRRARAKLQRRYQLGTLNTPSQAALRERRKSFLGSLRALAAEREELLAETRRLERKRRLFRRLVMG